MQAYYVNVHQLTKMQEKDFKGHRSLIQIQAFVSSLLRRYEGEKKPKS